MADKTLTCKDCSNTSYLLKATGFLQERALRTNLRDVQNAEKRERPSTTRTGISEDNQ